MNICLTATAALLLGMSACSYNSPPQLAQADDTRQLVLAALAEANIDTPVPRAAPVGESAAGPQALNSDNQLTFTRTRLNSNPNNPNVWLVVADRA